MIDQQGHFVLKIPGDPKYVGVVRLAVSGLASRLQLSYEDVEDIKLAVAEACARAITHGQGQEISVECEVLETSLSLSVTDQGTSPQDDEDLGIFLIRSLMDEVKFETSNGKGSRVSMIKRFSTKES